MSAREATALESELELGGRPLTPTVVVEVARGRRVKLSDDARARMLSTRSLLERLLARGDVVYGLTTGVGALKGVAVAREAQRSFNQLLLRAHVVGHGVRVPGEWVRATMVVRAAGLAIGAAGVRPEVPDAFCDALNAGFAPAVHRIGSVGQADLSQMAEIGLALTGAGPDGAKLGEHGLEPLDLGAREAHAIVNSNAFSTGVGCLGLDAALAATAALEVSAALAYEAIVGNVDQLHPEVDRLRPYRGHVAAATHLRALLAGGALADARTPARALQDVLSFKTIGQVQGAARDALAELDDQLRVELLSSGDSPIMIAAEDRAISTGNHDATPLGLALDYARLGLANAAMVAGERVQKLLTPHFSGLTSGLRADPSTPDDALGILGGVGIAALVAEIRMLAAPTMLEIPTSGVAEGVEDRISLAPVGAARLVEQAALTLRVAAIELVCAAQAIDLRGRGGELAPGTRRAYEATRARVPFVGAGEAPAADLEPLCAWLATVAPADSPAGSPAATTPQPGVVTDSAALARLAASDRPLTAPECAERARLVAALLDVSKLDRSGSGEAQLLWRNETSEAWLNLWWEPRDTGYHDHDGSGVGVYVIEGRAANEALALNRPARMREYGPGQSFAFDGDGIHRMEHDAGAVTIHVYSPPIQSLGHYELADGELRRRPGNPDDPSPPSPVLLAARRAGTDDTR
jgi:histidine ammonia-lyase